MPARFNLADLCIPLALHFFSGQLPRRDPHQQTFRAAFQLALLHSASCAHCLPPPLAARRSNSGVHQCPIPDCSRPTAIADSNARPFASREVLVTSPRRCASTIPRLTPSVQPRSSALTIKFFNLARFPVLSDSYSFAFVVVFVPLTVFPSNSSMAE